MLTLMDQLKKEKLLAQRERLVDKPFSPAVSSLGQADHNHPPVAASIVSSGPQSLEGTTHTFACRVRPLRRNRHHLHLH